MAEAPTPRELVLGVGRAFGGSLLFVLPILMTMEMWQFGTVLPPVRLAIWVSVALPLLAVLARSLAFRDTAGMSCVTTSPTGSSPTVSGSSRRLRCSRCSI